MLRFAQPRLVAALVVALACPLAVGQGSAAAPKAGAQGGKTLSLGGTGAGGGPILTREQLRDCIQRQDAITKNRTDIEAERAKLDTEREQIGADQQSLKAERARLEGSRDAASSLNERYRELAARVDAWNAVAKDVAERSGPSGDRGRRLHERERAEIQKVQAQLDAERAQLTADAENAVAAYNARAAEVDERARTWNERNNALVARAEQLNADRDLWAGECANRRYREDDEILLRKGAK